MRFENTMAKPEPTRNIAATTPGLLSEPTRSDVLSYVKFGAPSDRRSIAALYRAERSEEVTTAPSPELDGFLTVINLQPLAPFTLKRNGRCIRLPPMPRGTVGIHDLRNEYSAPTGLQRVFSLNLVFSLAFLEDMRSNSAQRAMDLLKDRVGYDFIDETLMHMALAVLPQFQRPETANLLFIDQMMIAAVTHLTGRYGSAHSSTLAPGRLSVRHERLAKEFLISNLRGNVALSDVAIACGLSSAYLARSFKKATGMPPYKWLLMQRLDLARTLLQSTDDTLTDIADACGFSDQSHFTRAFSRLQGVSPGAWRRLKRL
jgi:AraC family transcriptional regulator